VAPLSNRFGRNPGASFTLFHGAIIPIHMPPYLYPGSFIRSKELEAEIKLHTKFALKFDRYKSLQLSSRTSFIHNAKWVVYSVMYFPSKKMRLAEFEKKNFREDI
jgi:hypothetical protein